MWQHQWCFGCGGPGPCQLRYLPSPCVCTVSAPAGETEPGETVSAQAAKATTVTAKGKT